MDQEDKDRLTRVEAKMDLFLPIIPKVEQHEKDIYVVKKVGSLFMGFISILGIAASFFKHKG
jgi:hypothetical protein